MKVKKKIQTNKQSVERLIEKEKHTRVICFYICIFMNNVVIKPQQCVFLLWYFMVVPLTAHTLTYTFNGINKNEKKPTRLFSSSKSLFVFLFKAVVDTSFMYIYSIFGMKWCGMVWWINQQRETLLWNICSAKNTIQI